MKWLIAILAGFAFSTNIPAVLQSLEWIILILCVSGILIADRWQMGKSGSSDYTFTWTDPNMWITVFCLLSLVGLVGVYALNTVLSS